MGASGGVQVTDGGQLSAPAPATYRPPSSNPADFQPPADNADGDVGAQAQPLLVAAGSQASFQETMDVFIKKKD